MSNFVKMKALQIFVFAMFIGLTACYKKPALCFIADKTNTVINDSIHFTNCSEKGTKYQWNYGDGFTEIAEDGVHSYQRPGIFTVTLKAQSRNPFQGKTYSLSKTIVIEEPIYGCMDPSASNYDPLANVDDNSCTYPGSVTFWTANSSWHHIRLSLVTGFAGQIDFVSSTAPNCENGAGSLKLTLPSGLYTYDAIMYNSSNQVLYTTGGAFNVIGASCNLFKIN